MREVKFRAWDLDNFNIYYSDIEQDNGEGMIVWIIDSTGVYFEEPTPVPWYDPEDIQYYKPNQVVMQYTGLKDKDGVEIYEGDVVDFTYYDDKLKGTSRGLVAWDENFHMWYLSGRKGVNVPLHAKETYEVIGNIYENPELLKGDE